MAHGFDFLGGHPPYKWHLVFFTNDILFSCATHAPTEDRDWDVT
jgi:hypothetical protein